MISLPSLTDALHYGIVSKWTFCSTVWFMRTYMISALQTFVISLVNVSSLMKRSNAVEAFNWNRKNRYHTVAQLLYFLWCRVCSVTKTTSDGNWHLAIFLHSDIDTAKAKNNRTVHLKTMLLNWSTDIQHAAWASSLFTKCKREVSLHLSSLLLSH